jgi:hypothetical protein
MSLPNGFYFRETPGHGYYSCAEVYNNNVPKLVRAHEYEEDCAWSIPVVFNKDLFPEKEYNQALQTFKDWFPKEYEQIFNVVLMRGESSMKDSHFYDLKENESKYMKRGAWGDWCFDVPEGMTYAILRKIVPPYNYGFKSGEGEEISVLMPSETYSNGENNFFEEKDFTRYVRNDMYYTWDEYTKKTGQERFK